MWNDRPLDRKAVRRFLRTLFGGNRDPPWRPTYCRKLAILASSSASKDDVFELSKPEDFVPRGFGLDSGDS
jgi:hypothetical protein